MSKIFCAYSYMSLRKAYCKLDIFCLPVLHMVSDVFLFLFQDNECF